MLIGISGLIALPPAAYLITNFMLKKHSNIVTKIAIENGVNIKPKKIGINVKTYYSFLSAMVGMTLFALSAIYYYSINTTIDMKSDDYSKIQEHFISKYKNIESSNLSSLILFIKEFDYNTEIKQIIVDKSGKIVYNPHKVSFINNINSELFHRAIKEQKKGNIYENKHNNLISYYKLNSNYTLLFITNITEFTDWFKNYIYWSLLLIILGGTVMAQIIIFFSGSLKFSTKKLRTLLGKMANGNLTELSGKDTTDEMGDIIDDYNITISKMKTLILNINRTASSVLRASNQLSSMSGQMSEGANEQASTTEEIASSMEEILAIVSSNIQNAEITEKVTQKSAKEIKHSNKAFRETIKAVSNISNKTKIITDISFQTNILSLNASIEAARAGKYGKGFAVVAQEVRKLAEKSKEASDKITELSQNGNNISKIAGEKLDILIPEIIKSAELVNDIVLAGKEQQTGIEAINISIQQLTEITNENSASAEEMSASAEELSAQAEQLKELISVFRIGNFQNEKADINLLNQHANNNIQMIGHREKEHGLKLNLSKNDNLDGDYEKY